jgi:hypothetical protein
MALVPLVGRREAHECLEIEKIDSGAADNLRTDIPTTSTFYHLD